MRDLYIIGGTLLALALLAWWTFRPRRRAPVGAFPPAWRALLRKSVRYYQRLDPTERQRFERHLQHFLQDVQITGVETTVEDLDRLLIAASAVIPIFGFPDWTHYSNLSEVLLYPNNFNGDTFNTQRGKRQVLGMVGWSYMNGKMILSKTALRQAFLQGGKSNVGIHEFIHLLDKLDGAVDGVPEYLLQDPYLTPWLHLIHVEMQKIRAGKSDIPAYGGTSETEFLAVAGEYFFQRPERLQKRHPEVYRLMEILFLQDPDGDGIGR